MHRFRFCLAGMLVACGLFIGPRAWAFFPFSFGKQEIKTDYTQTVWDRMMLEQSYLDVHRGLAEMSQAHYKDASNSFAKAVIKNTQDPLPYLLLGASLYWEGRVDEAVSEYREALRLDPKQPLAYQLLGIAAGWKGDIRQAQEYFLKANELDPNKADTHMNLGSTYTVLREPDKALEHYRQAVELAPREPLYHYQLGTLYEALGRDAQAKDSFKKALRLFPAYEDAQLSLGALYEKLGDFENALKYYKKAVRTKPGDYVARLRYAFLLTRQGQVQKARSVLEEAFSISRFKADGLALNAVYRASGRTAQDFETQISQFAAALAKVSPSKPVQIETSLEYRPLAAPSAQSSARGETFEQAYTRLHGENSLAQEEAVRTFKRSFMLAEGTADERNARIEQFVEGLRQAVAAGGKDYNVNLSLQGRTVDYAAPYALTQTNTAAPKAVYDPRIVGNDMGLWVTGRTWLLLVDEAREELQDFAPACPPDNTCALLTGLASLASGDGNAAQAEFLKAAAIAPQDVLAQLGLGTAAVVRAEDEAAVRFYQRALELDPKNKTAARNLKVLAE